MLQKVKSVVLHDTESNKQSKQSFAKEVIEGLKQKQKKIDMKFAYDEAGSKLYLAMLQNPSYYLFTSDKQIIQTKGSEILKVIGAKNFNLVDLGAGDGLKTEIFLQTAIKEGYDIQYTPLDINLDSNVELSERVNSKFPTLEITTVTAQFKQGMDWISKNQQTKNVFFLLGGIFGNQTLEESEQFAEMLCKYLRSGETIFITIDIWKDTEVILKSYTQNNIAPSFILNSLVRLNKQLNCNINLNNFSGYPYLDPFTRIMQGVIISKESQQVQIMNQLIYFKKAEVINSIMSKKFLQQEVIQIFQNRGFKSVGIFRDSKQYLAIMGFEKNDNQSSIYFLVNDTKNSLQLLSLNQYIKS